MVQHNNAHLTIAQLSAYVDKELAPEELALCEAHIQICQPCQAALADLRLTSTLLNGMPMVEVPRSFTLPTNMIVLPETPAASKAQTRQPERLGRVLRRTLRTLSTVAAVLGLLFILAGALSAFSHGGTSATLNSAAAPSTQSSGSQVESPELTATASGLTPRIPSTAQAASATRSPVSTITPVPTPTPAGAQPGFDGIHRSPQQPAAPPPAVLDPGQPEGKLSIGGGLFVLGVLGVALTRRSRRAR